MTTSALAVDPRVERVSFDGDRLVVRLKDEREISAPVAWFPRLAGASETQLANWRVTGGGRGIHWPDIDEDLSVEGLLAGERPR